MMVLFIRYAPAATPCPPPPSWARTARWRDHFFIGMQSQPQTTHQDRVMPLPPRLRRHRPGALRQNKLMVGILDAALRTLAETSRRKPAW